ncbi:hypothetical protein UlMin_033392 [Ulmus minor]
MGSSSVPNWKYDVFISFRGEDTRNSFTSFLHDALRREKIKTYIDNEDLGRGDEISPALMRAIEESMISVVVFSENYANSSWCLDELVHILKCKREYGRQVVPVFYKVDPSDVRNQRGSYAIAFSKRGSYANAFAKRKKCFEQKLESRRTALREAGNLAGWDLQDTSGNESKLVEKIVEDILKKLNDMSPSYDHEYLKGLFGTEKHIKQIESLLDIGTPKVRILGIWGMGGIGKTTLARVLFNKFSHLFEGRCFLSNVREKSKNPDGFIVLKVELLSKLLNRKDLDPDNIAFARNCVRRQKVFLVLDDVSHEAQLRVLCGDRGDLFGPGSRVIVTTRDKRALIHQVNDVYKLDGLNRDDALGLFHWHAFKETSPSPDFNELSKQVVDYAGGNPLALEISGSFFRGREIEDWKSLLERLKETSIEDEGSVQKILKISYDELRKDEKVAFLDIVCCFNGSDKFLVERLVDVTIIKDLVDKSLIIDEDGDIFLHDLVAEMGRSVVRESSGGDLGKQSRIWNGKDVYSVLHNNIDTKKIEAICLDQYGDEDGDGEGEGEGRCKTQLDLPRDVFRTMHNLRLLKVSYEVHLPEGLEFLPDSLKYLEWDYYPLKSLPKNFNPCNLVLLKMRGSDELEQLWDDVKDLHNLRKIDLSYCTNLTQLPDLSRASKLESVDLEECRSLKKFSLSKAGIEEVCSSSFDSLSCLSIDGCPRLEIFSEIEKPMKNLRELDLTSIAIKEPLRSIENLVNLQRLSLDDCEGLKLLPNNIWKLYHLISIRIANCSKLNIFPEIEEPVENLKYLLLQRIAIKELPRSIENLVNLQWLSLDDCEELKLLPNSIWKLYHLESLNIFNCSKLNIFPEIEEPMENLMCLRLQRTAIKELPRSIENLVNLQELSLSDCEALPNTICKLYHLNDLSIVNCSNASLIFEQHWFDQCIANFSVSVRRVAVEMCWAGDKIPRWFSYQNKKSSLSMKLCLNSFDNNFLGIAFCVVVHFNGFIRSGDYELCCQAHFDGAPDGVLFTRRYRHWGQIWALQGDHVFMRCDKSSREDFMKKLKEYKANQNVGCTSISLSFKFSFECCTEYKSSPRWSNLEVKKCGVYLLYAKDDEKFGIKIGEKGVDKTSWEKGIKLLFF